MRRKPDEDVAFAVDLTNMCETFHALPRQGGLLDQDSLHVYMMRSVIVAQREKAEAERGRQNGLK
jgi:hypothetical protein